MFGKGVLYIMSLGNSDKDVRLAQLDRASDYGSEGREFESSSTRSNNHMVIHMVIVLLSGSGGMADAQDSDSCPFMVVWVQVPSSA